MLPKVWKPIWLAIPNWQGTTPHPENVKKEVETVTVMNEQIKKAIRTRARKARSNDEVVEAIFGTLREHRIDLRHVSLEEMKSAVVEATRASRESSGVHISRPA